MHSYSFNHVDNYTIHNPTAYFVDTFVLLSYVHILLLIGNLAIIFFSSNYTPHQIDTINKSMNTQYSDSDLTESEQELSEDKNSDDIESNDIVSEYRDSDDMQSDERESNDMESDSLSPDDKVSDDKVSDDKELDYNKNRNEELLNGLKNMLDEFKQLVDENKYFREKYSIKSLDLALVDNTVEIDNNQYIVTPVTNNI